MINSVLHSLSDRSMPVTDSGCLVWMGSTLPSGYGRVTVNGKPILVHRLAYEIRYGSIPEGKVIDHLCRVRCCINPDHLEPVTIGENFRRGKPGKWKRTIRTVCVNGHDYTGDNVRWDRGYKYCLECKRIQSREWHRKND